jgi:flagellar hook-associated protein 2
MAGMAGIASGVDTNALVDQLMALERQSLTRLGYRQTAITGQQDGLKEIASKLSALKTAARALASDATWAQNQAVESSDPARVAVARTGGAGIGGHTVQVNRLAASMQRGYAFDGAAGGSISIAYDEGEPKQISVAVAPGATLKSVADAINAKGDGPVVAAVVKNGAGEDRLVLSSRKTGSESDFTVTGGSILTEDGAYATADPSLLDASYSLNGGPPVTSQTNVLENAIPGLRITLKGVTAAPATLNVGAPELDRAAVKGKVKAFVEAYNAVVDTTRAKLTEKPMSNPTSDFQAARGQLFGDSGLNSMLSKLRQEMTEILDGTGIDDLGDLGITVPKATGGTVSEDGKAGRLVLDEAKLTDALESDWTAVQGFFGSFADDVDALVNAQTGGSGVIDDRLKNSKRGLDRLQDQVERTNERLEQKEKRMRAQFAAMEVALQNAQSQQAWLTGQLAALERMNRQ